MKEQLIQFKTAKLAIEKGFDLTTGEYYDRRDYNKSWNIVEIFNKRNIGKKAISAPTQSLLQTWLRDECGVEVNLKLNKDIIDSRVLFIDAIEVRRFIIKNKKWHRWHDRLTEYEKITYTYEQALEAGLIEALKLI